MSITAVIVEDSRLARQGLKKMLASFDFVELLAEAENAEQGTAYIEELRPDLLFLDVDMPDKNCFELLSGLSYQPSIIFTTAFSEYAIRSFEYNTVDYLLKPIEPERLARALEKISVDSEPGEIRESVLNEESRIFIKDREKSHIVPLRSIRKFESCGNHTRVYFDDKAPFIYKSLSKVERRLPSNMFFRINRQLIVNLQFSASLDEVASKYFLNMVNGESLPLSRNQFAKLKQMFSL